MANEWQPKYQASLIRLMGHDEDGLRWHAAEILMGKIDRSFDPELKKLLEDPDPRRRGLAAYLAMSLWKDEAITVLRPWLREPSQLLRFDAISALVQHGSEEARKVVEEHRRTEKQPYLQRVLEMRATGAAGK